MSKKNKTTHTPAMISVDVAKGLASLVLSDSIDLGCIESKHYDLKFNNKDDCGVLLTAFVSAYKELLDKLYPEKARKECEQ